MEQTSPEGASQPNKAAAQGNETLMAVLAYLGILIIIPFLMAKNEPFVKFHIRQGLVLVVIEIAIWVLGALLGTMLWQFWPLLQLVNLATLILAIVGIVNVINHKEAELPLVGSYARSFNI